ncbi:MAG: protein kinase [Pseudomonadota bacterium]
MNRDDQLEVLFAGALEQPADERADWLRDACGDNQEIYDEVISLLGASGDASRFVDRLSDNLHSLAATPMELPTGLRIDRWRVVELIGRGGMGAVYRVERVDADFEQTAALKILPLGFSDARVIEEFERERQILAHLQHDHIAQLIDGGVAEDGTPYFVMEHVDGVPIDQFCDDRKLSITARVRLFLGVVAAVAHAHTRLVVHRDIKPSNVLVTSDGSVKLLDFGIAKLLTDGSGQRTRVRALTPDFAAPEQLIGDTATTATDVYSLGLLLYTLLAGGNPRAGESSTPDQMLPRLSTFATDENLVDAETAERRLHVRQATLSSLRRSLRGDLDNILARATETYPRYRYQSAGDFGADLRRFLDDEPVHAQPQTLRYRCRKFVRRHRGGVATAVLTAVCLVAAVVITAMQAHEARVQRDAAVFQSQRVAGTHQFLQVLFSELRDVESPLTATDMLDRGLELLTSGDDQEPIYSASTMFMLSSYYQALGDHQTRQELVDRAIATAEGEGNTRFLQGALCARARMRVFDDPESARADLARGRALIATLRSGGAAGTMDCLEAEALLLSREQNYEGARKKYSDALSILDGVRPPQPLRRANLLNKLGEQYFNDANPGRALDLLAESIETYEDIGLGDTMSVMIYRINRAAVLMRVGEVHEASSQQSVVIDAASSLGKPIIGFLSHYGSSLVILERFPEALAVFERALADAESGGNRRWIAFARMGLGRTYLLMGDRNEAEQHLAVAESIFSEAGASQQRHIDLIQRTRIEAMFRAGEVDKAANLLTDELRQRGYSDEPLDFSLAGYLLLASEIANARSEYEDALRFAVQAATLYRARARGSDRSGFEGAARLQQAIAEAGLKHEDAPHATLISAARALEVGFGNAHPLTRRARFMLDQTDSISASNGN